jgi:hypothetical protein
MESPAKKTMIATHKTLRVPTLEERIAQAQAIGLALALGLDNPLTPPPLHVTALILNTERSRN